jgi:hypothetical protein
MFLSSACGSGATSPPDASLPCSGSWTGAYPSGPLVGQAATIDLGPTGVMTRASSGAIVQGNWSLVNGSIWIQDQGEGTNPNACPVDNVGFYTVTFGGGCASLTFAGQADSCTDRLLSLDGWTGTR